MKQPDQIINAGWIVPVEPAATVYTNHALVLRDGLIDAILPCEVAAERYQTADTIDRPGHVLIPGFVNAHTHAAMTLFRGYARDLPLEQWLGERIWPAETRWASAEFVRDGTALAINEMLRSGTTCFQDMYFFPDVVGEAAAARGIRATVGMIVLEAPTVWAREAGEYIDKGLAVQDRFRGSSLIRASFAPHAPYSVADASFERIRLLADELETQIQMHIHETAAEVAAALTNHGRRPLARLDALGLITPQLAAVHMTQLNPEEIGRIAEQGASVVHCAESNLMLASGFCPVAKLRHAGINVALGTDGAGSNNDLDMFGEMRTAALLGKGVAGDAAALTAADALEMATLGGARALGRGDETGSLKPGKAADIIAVDLGIPACQPVYDPVAQLVYAAGRDQVSDVWIGGTRLIVDGELVDDDTADVVERAAAWRRRLTEHGDA